jgi:hypothetical protein
LGVKVKEKLKNWWNKIKWVHLIDQDIRPFIYIILVTGILLTLMYWGSIGDKEGRRLSKREDIIKKTRQYKADAEIIRLKNKIYDMEQEKPKPKKTSTVKYY